MTFEPKKSEIQTHDKMASQINTGGGAGAEAMYKLKLSIDVREAKSFKVAANVIVKFGVQLAGQYHQFKSEQPT